MVGQAVEQRVHGREAVEGVLGQFLEHGRQVARVGDQDGLAARAHAQHHVHGEREDVVQRQRADAGLLFACGHLLHHGVVPRLGLQHVGDHVAVQQHGALAHTRGAAGVLQQRDVVRLDVGLLERAARALGHRVIEAHGTRQVVGGHHLLDVAHHIVDERALEQAQLVAHGAQHHVLDGRVRNAALQRGGEVFDDDDGLGTRVLELMLQFARRVQRVHIDHHKTCAQDGGHRDGILRHVGHHDGHTVALDQAQALQVGRKRTAQGVGLGIGHFLAHEAVGHAARVLGERLVHEGHERRILRGVDVCGDALRIGSQPGAMGHCCLLISFIEVVKTVLRLTARSCFFRGGIMPVTP